MHAAAGGRAVEAQSELKNRPIDSSRILVRNVAETEIPAVREIVERVCDLFSFASESRVCCYQVDFPAEGTLLERRSVIGLVQYWRPPFHTTDDIKRFVETGYPHYDALRVSRELRVVIDYIYHAVMRGIAMECQLLFCFVLLENLRHTFLAMTPAWKKSSLEKDLVAMFAAVGMTPNIARIVMARNELVHEGTLEMTVDERWKLFEFCMTVVREYVLRLLRYRGSFLHYDLSAGML